MADRDAIFPANPHPLYEEHGYSPAIRANGLLFVSGMVGARQDGTPEPELSDEIRLAFQNLLGVLDAAGCTFDDVVDTTMFLTDPERDLETLFSVLPEFWGAKPYPTLTGIGVNWLAGFRFEIKVVAKLPESN